MDYPRMVAMVWLGARLSSFLSRLAGRGWREIATAPFDRAIELAVIDGDVGVPTACCIRHGEGFLDAETLRPVDIAATHWRYRQTMIFPVSCC
jgi:hypothetical protein